MAIKRNGVFGNRTVTNVVIDSEVEEWTIFRRAYELTVQSYLFLPLYSSSAVFSPARTMSLVDYSIKSIWSWRRALHMRGINVVFT